MTRSKTVEAIFEVEAFIASCRSEAAEGAAWSRTPDAERSPRTLYHGSAGVVLFYLELHRAFGDRTQLDEATRAGDEIVAYVDGQDFITVGFYSGWPGYIFVLNELAKATNEKRFRDAAVRFVDRMADQSQELGVGIGWIEPMPFSDITGITGDREVLDLSVGGAGAGLGLLYAHRHGLEPNGSTRSALDLAKKTADRLLEMSVATEDGPNWLMAADMPFPFTASNFAHGAAGVGYFLADLYRATGTQAYLDEAIAAAGYVKSKASPSGDGHLVCHTNENPELFYLGVCHGPPGTDRLMVLLAEITEDSTWLDWVDANVAGLVATGAPQTRTRGLWQNYGQCCGDAGIGDFALSMYATTGTESYRSLAETIAVGVLEASEIRDGHRWWNQAEHRTRPDFVETQTGYMQGAAGIGSFLLHLATIDDDAVCKIALPDSPFTR